MIDKLDLNPKSKGGGSFIRLAPIFLNNGQYIFISWRNIIYCYNTRTGKRYLEYKGIEDEIVGFGVTTFEECDYLFACSNIGLVVAWKVENGLRIKKKEIVEKKEILGFKVIKDTSEAVLLLKKKDMICFLLLNLQTMTSTKIKTQIAIEGTFKWDVGGSLDDLYCCIVNKKAMHYLKLHEIDATYSKKLINSKLTCVACHPDNGWVLVGDTLGRIYLWYNLKEKSPEHAIYHWHTLPVEALCFSSSGMNFYSGAGECVLVKWTIDRPKEQKFLPRLNSEIKQISVSNDNIYLAFATNDNVINIIDSQFNFVSTVQNLVLSSHFSAGICFDPRTKSLVMNGVSGHLQFYSPHDMNLLYNLDIVGMNKLTQERHALVINTEVVKIAIDRFGVWLATYEEYDDTKEDCYESRLKFWIFNDTKQTFELNTSIEDPHNLAIKSISFQPTKTSNIKACCVTIGKDKTFKIWQIIDKVEIEKKRTFWICVAAGFYKDLSPTSLAFSFDGSLLAVSFEKILTTWLPNTCELKCSLVHPIHKENLHSCAFATGNNSHLVVGASKHRIFVWNLLTLSLVWTVSLKIKRLISDSLVPFMGVLTHDNALFIFEPSSPDPLYGKSNLVSEEKSILSATFCPTMLSGDNSKDWYYKAQLFFLDSNKELFCLEANRPEEIIQNQLLDNSFISLFSQMTPQVRNKTMDKLQPVVHNYKKSDKTKLNDFLSSSAHSMPPMRLLCFSILNTMISEKQYLAIEKSEREFKKEKIEDENEAIKMNTNLNINPACLSLAL